MAVAKILRKLKFIPETRLLELYPPFLFMGVKVKSITRDYKKMTIHLPLRWYGTNQFGTMFGGFICAVADPLHALMCGRIFPGTEVWTKGVSVDFIKPGRTLLQFNAVITDEDLAAIKMKLESEGKTTYVFNMDVTDKAGTLIAKVQNSVYLRKKGA